MLYVSAKQGFSFKLSTHSVKLISCCVLEGDEDWHLGAWGNWTAATVFILSSSCEQHERFAAMLLRSSHVACMHARNSKVAIRQVKPNRVTTGLLTSSRHFELFVPHCSHDIARFTTFGV